MACLMSSAFNLFSKIVYPLREISSILRSNSPFGKYLSLTQALLSKSKFVNSLRTLGFDYINSRRKITNSLVNYATGVNL